jgi:hypothetical protein
VRAAFPGRRKLALLVPLTALFSASWLAPLPQAQSRQLPRTVARTIDVPVRSLAGATDVGGLRVSGDTVRAIAPTRTPRETVCAPIWSTMVAFAWHQTGVAQIGTSVLDDGGDAASVLQDQDADPDPRTPEYHPGLRTSPLYWTRGSRCVRFSMRMPAGVSVSHLRAQFINTSGTAAGPGTGPAGSPVSSVLGSVFGAAAASASPARPDMVTRAEWGAIAPRKNCLGYTDEIKMAYVHHTSGSNDYTPAQSDDIMRGIQYYHEHTRGYCDIAYSFLVDKYGTIFVGRYDSDNTKVNVTPGSQAGFNTYTFSISAMGNYQNVPPSAATIQAVQRVLAWRLDIAHLPPLGTATMTSSGGSTTRYKRGTTVKLPLISGHRQTGITDCPGNLIWDQLSAIRQTVLDTGRPKFFRPAGSRSVVTPFVNSDRFTAQATDALKWEVDLIDENGDVQQSLYGQGTSLDVTWDGMDRDGLPAPPGTYSAVVYGWTSDGAMARSATLEVAVNPAPPVPSP